MIVTPIPLPKIQIGLTQQEVVDILGYPKSIHNSPSPASYHWDYDYESGACNSRLYSSPDDCCVRFDINNKAISQVNIKRYLTDIPSTPLAIVPTPSPSYLSGPFRIGDFKDEILLSLTDPLTHQYKIAPIYNPYLGMTAIVFLGGVGNNCAWQLMFDNSENKLVGYNQLSPGIHMSGTRCDLILFGRIDDNIRIVIN